MTEVKKTWNDFLKSGKVNDYINYRREVEVNDTERVVTQGVTKDEPEHRRNSDKGTEYW